MPERLRLMLDRPLGPVAARGVVVLSDGRGGVAASGTGGGIRQAGAEFDRPFDHRFDQLIDLPFGDHSLLTRLNPLHAADSALPIFQRSLRHIEVGT